MVCFGICLGFLLVVCCLFVFSVFPLIASWHFVMWPFASVQQAFGRLLLVVSEERGWVVMLMSCVAAEALGGVTSGSLLFQLLVLFVCSCNACFCQYICAVSSMGYPDNRAVLNIAQNKIFFKIKNKLIVIYVCCPSWLFYPAIGKWFDNFCLLNGSKK